MTDERRCDGCAYYVAAKHYYGECRRHAPAPAVPVGEYDVSSPWPEIVPDDYYVPTSYWPEVNANEWCGEWEAKA